MSGTNLTTTENASAPMPGANGNYSTDQLDLNCSIRAVDTSPIEEALKNALTGENKSKKTPVSLLYELLGRRGITPQYELLPTEETPVHELLFRYRVSYPKAEAIGSGKSKKEAKHAAAMQLIDKLTADDVGEPPKTGKKTPIMVLQEVLNRRGISPQYELLPVEGVAREPTFQYRVFYEDKDATGMGKSKKEAKQAAAKALIDKLAGHGFWDTHVGVVNFVAEIKQQTAEPSLMTTSSGADSPVPLGATSPNISKRPEERRKNKRTSPKEDKVVECSESKRKTKEVKALISSIANALNVELPSFDLE